MAELKTTIKFKRDTSANWETNKNKIPAAGEPCYDLDAKTLKIGDGTTTYENLPAFYTGAIPAAATHYEGIRADGEEDMETIARVLKDASAPTSKDDIFIVKTLISNDKYSHTAYVYNGSAWVAMDGNYNAENVYFDEDMLFTYAFGKYKLSNGNVTIPSAGKSLKELLMSAHVDIINPTSTAPGFSIDASSNKTGEVGTAYSLPTATATFTDGKYSYGYVDSEGKKVSGTNTAAGIIASTIDITCDKSSDVKNATNTNSATLSLTAANLNDGISKDLLFEDTAITYKFTATCTYPASTRTPTNNVGETSNSDTGVEYSPISGGKWSTDNSTQKTDSCTVTGWRKMFMGTVDSTNTNTAIDTTLIRTTMNKLVNAQVSTNAQTFTVPVGATKIIVACPEEYVISKCEYFTMSWEEIALFPHLKDENGADKMVQVADARGGTNGLKNYNVYTFTHASPTGFEAATQYRVTLKKKA